MNEAPKELTGRELLRHAAKLHEALEAGEEIELWVIRYHQWVSQSRYGFSGPLHLYRVKPKPRVWWVNVMSNGHTTTHTNREWADNTCDGPSRVARVKVTEGQFDE